jgi:POT family proton-dependent oligopeptide transporter
MKLLRITPHSLCPSISWRYLELPKITATGIVGAYGAPVYLSTVLCGWIADRLFGVEHTVLCGGVGVMCVHIALAIIGGLAVSALDSRALKANASSLLGTLYEKGDARCDGGYKLFNLGAFIGPLITGLLQTHAGFHYGFGAAVGIVLGLA